MAHLQYFDYPGFGEKQSKEAYYSQAVRYDNIIEIAGQGGWTSESGDAPDDFAAQVERAFKNVETTLKHAGGTGWDQVFKVRCYTTETTLEVLEVIVSNMKRFCPNHKPALTAVGVASLYLGLKVEIEVSAHVGK